MSTAGKRASLGLMAVGVIVGIALARVVLHDYLIAPPLGQFCIFTVLISGLIVCTYFLPIVPARIMQFLSSCALGCLLVALAVGR